LYTAGAQKQIVITRQPVVYTHLAHVIEIPTWNAINVFRVVSYSQKYFSRILYSTIW